MEQFMPGELSIVVLMEFQSGEQTKRESKAAKRTARSE